MNFLNITTLVSGVLSAIAAFLLTLLSSPTKPKNQRNKKRKKLICLVTLVVSLLILVTSVIMIILQSLDIYNPQLNQLWAKASNYGNTGEFSSAASEFHQVATLAKNSKLKCQAYLNEAECYMKLGYETENLDCFQNAIFAYKELIEYGKYPQYKLVHAQILMGIGSCYVFLERTEDLEELKEIIAEMYTFLPLKDVNYYGAEALNYCISRSMINGWYNGFLYQTTRLEEYAMEAKALFEEALTIEDLYESRYYSNASDSQLKNSLFIWIGDYYFMIAENEDLLSSINDLKWSIDYYSRVKFNTENRYAIEIEAEKTYKTARSYIMLSFISQINCNENRWSAYLLIKPYLNIVDESLDPTVQYMAQLAIQSCYFTDEDEANIIKLFDRLLENTSFSKQPYAYVETRIQQFYTYANLCILKRDSNYFLRSKLIYEEISSVLLGYIDQVQIEYINEIWNILLKYE